MFGPGNGNTRSVGEGCERGVAASLFSNLPTRMPSAVKPFTSRNVSAGTKALWMSLPMLRVLVVPK